MWDHQTEIVGRRSASLSSYVGFYTGDVLDGEGNAVKCENKPQLFSFGNNTQEDIEYTFEELPGANSTLFPESKNLVIWNVSREDLRYMRPKFIMLCFTRRVIFYRLYDLRLTRTLLELKLQNREEELQSLSQRATKVGGNAFGHDFVASDILHAKYQRMYGQFSSNHYRQVSLGIFSTYNQKR